MKREIKKICIRILKESGPELAMIGGDLFIKLAKYGSDKIGSMTYDKKKNEIVVDALDDIIDIEQYELYNAENNKDEDLINYVDEFNGKFKLDQSNTIKHFRGDYFFLSSYYICNINYKGINYSTAEAAFQSMKTKNIKERKEFIYLTPKEARKKGREVSLREDWEQIKEDVMYNICLCKFNQNQDLADKLIMTGNTYLQQESSWNDKEWGTVNDQGENKLGKILMRVREELNKDI